MDTKENLHQGHRQRLLKKFFESGDALVDHEVLECLLFYAIPRCDTNPLAHKLLKIFGSLNGVLQADRKELLAIKGVGEKTANMLMVVGGVYKRALSRNQVAPQLNNMEKLKIEVKKQFDAQNIESSLLFLLDKNHNKIIQLYYSNNSANEVSLDLNEIVQAFATFHPVYAILAHNHPTHDCYPSLEDDKTTKKLCVLCSIHGVTLLEHLIYGGSDSFYSYQFESRLDRIKNQADINKLLDLGGLDND